MNGWLVQKKMEKIQKKLTRAKISKCENFTRRVDEYTRRQKCNVEEGCVLITLLKNIQKQTHTRKYSWKNARNYCLHWSSQILSVLGVHTKMFMQCIKIWVCLCYLDVTFYECMLVERLGETRNIWAIFTHLSPMPVNDCTYEFHVITHM